MSDHTIHARVFTNLDGPTPHKAAYGDWTKSWEAMFPGVPVAHSATAPVNVEK